MIKPEQLCRNMTAAALGALLLIPSLPANAQTAATFDINRYSGQGSGRFETYYVEDTQTLQSALDSKLLAEDTLMLVTSTAGGNLAMIRDQMAFHHIAQGTAAGKDWMATF